MCAIHPLGGVEFAFMSTTTKREVALDYASRGKAGVIFEIMQGMVDRGADLSWLSQYPQACFPGMHAGDSEQGRASRGYGSHSPRKRRMCMQALSLYVLCP